MSQNHLLKSSVKIGIIFIREESTLVGDTFWNDDDDGACDDVVVVVDGLVEYLIVVDIFLFLLCRSFVVAVAQICLFFFTNCLDVDGKK